LTEAVRENPERPLRAVPFLASPTDLGSRLFALAEIVQARRVFLPAWFPWKTVEDLGETTEVVRL
jgi:hypothetical protein